MKGRKRPLCLELPPDNARTQTSDKAPELRSSVCLLRKLSAGSETRVCEIRDHSSRANTDYCTEFIRHYQLESLEQEPRVSQYTSLAKGH